MITLVKNKIQFEIKMQATLPTNFITHLVRQISSPSLLIFF